MFDPREKFAWFHWDKNYVCHGIAMKFETLLILGVSTVCMEFLQQNFDDCLNESFENCDDFLKSDFKLLCVYWWQVVLALEYLHNHGIIHRYGCMNKNFYCLSILFVCLFVCLISYIIQCYEFSLSIDNELWDLVKEKIAMFVDQVTTIFFNGSVKPFFVCLFAFVFCFFHKANSKETLSSWKTRYKFLLPNSCY